MKVKVTCFWKEEKDLLNLLSKYAFGETRWKDMELVTTDDFDVLVILTRPHPKLKNYDSKKAITILTEPPVSKNVRAHATSAILPMYLPLPFWEEFSDKDNEFLTNEVPKSELFSSVTSELGGLDGHVARIQLISVLDKVISEGFDLWGKKHTNLFFKDINSYRGEIYNKYDALWSYQYHFACENFFFENYFTEKIADPIIAECLCFYDGCKNIEEFIDERAFIKINVNEPIIAIENMIKAIEQNEWDKRIKYIKQQKMRFLNELNPLNIIWLSVSGKDVMKECKLN